MKGIAKHKGQGEPRPDVPALRTLAERLAISPKSPARWRRDPGLRDGPQSREWI